MDKMRIYLRHQPASYPEASLPQCENKILSEAWEGKFEAAVKEDSTSGPRATKDHITCPAEDKVILIDKQIQFQQKNLFFNFVSMRNVLMQSNRRSY